MEIQSKLSYKEYRKASLLITYRKPLMFILTVVGVLLLIWAALYYAGIKSFIKQPAFFQLFFGFIAVVYMPLSVQWKIKRHYKKNTRLQEQLTYKFSKNKVQVNGETFSSEMDWKDAYKVEVLKEWVLIYQHKLSVNIIPRHAFGDQLPNFIQMLESKPIRLKVKE